MSRGTDFTLYKETILYKIIESENIVQALSNNKTNFLDEKIAIDPTSLIYNNIFPYRLSSKTFTEPKSLITMRFANFKPIGNKFRDGNIYFYIICHNSLIRTDYGLRYDFIFKEIDDLFTSSRDIGIGKLELFDVSDLDIDENYMGSVCVFHVTDFA